jgi:hypothetical protein
VLLQGRIDGLLISSRKVVRSIENYNYARRRLGSSYVEVANCWNISFSGYPLGSTGPDCRSLEEFFGDQQV